MGKLFEPSISYWPDNGNATRDTGYATPAGALSKTKQVLLIHGFNNTRGDASDAYTRFLQLQNELRPVTANLLGVYWPGSNWEGPLYYMQAITQAKKVAPYIAKDLLNAARAMGYMEIDIIAHSLGCRLALETVREILRLKNEGESVSALVIKQVVFMAAAVPTRYLEELQVLRSSITAFLGTMSIFSENDGVLTWAFPLGQSVVGEGFLPVALGRKQWMNGAYLYRPLKQERNSKAGHSDYWGGSDKNLPIKRQAAKSIAGFLSLGPLLSRETAEREVFGPRDNTSRDTTTGRQVPKR